MRCRCMSTQGTLHSTFMHAGVATTSPSVLELCVSQGTGFNCGLREAALCRSWLPLPQPGNSTIFLGKNNLRNAAIG